MTSYPSLIFCFRHVFSPFILLHLCNSSFLPKFPLLTARPMHIYLEIHFKFYLFNGASPDSHLIVELTPILWDPMCGSDFCHNALILALIFFLKLFASSANLEDGCHFLFFSISPPNIRQLSHAISAFWKGKWIEEWWSVQRRSLFWNEELIIWLCLTLEAWFASFWPWWANLKVWIFLRHNFNFFILTLWDTSNYWETLKVPLKGKEWPHLL